jgi:hypothetical protein
MRIQLETEYATPTMTASMDDIIDLPDAQAQELIKQRFAVAVSEDVRRRHKNPPGLVVEAVGAPDDRWTDPDTLGVLIDRDERLRRA